MLPFPCGLITLLKLPWNQYFASVGWGWNWNLQLSSSRLHSSIPLGDCAICYVVNRTQNWVEELLGARSSSVQAFTKIRNRPYTSIIMWTISTKPFMKALSYIRAAQRVCTLSWTSPLQNEILPRKVSYLWWLLRWTESSTWNKLPQCDLSAGHCSQSPGPQSLLILSQLDAVHIPGMPTFSMTCCKPCVAGRLVHTALQGDALLSTKRESTT